MKLTSLVALLVTSNLVLAEPPVDMVNAPAGTHKQKLCVEDKPNDCRTAVWIPYHSDPDNQGYEQYIDINSIRFDEEDVFLTHKALWKGTIPVSGVISHLRFDCERSLYKLLLVEASLGDTIVNSQIPNEKPASIELNEIAADLYQYGCFLHNAAVNGGQ